MTAGPLAKLLLATVIVGGPAAAATMVQDTGEERPEQDPAPPVEGPGDQQVLEDFGSGLRAFVALVDDPELDLEEIKALYEAAQEALETDRDVLILADGLASDRQQEELVTFRNELRQQVVEGTLSRDEVLGTWLEVADVRFFHRFDRDDVPWSDRMLDASRTGNLAPIRLRVPEAGDVRVLVRPEFLMRDLKVLAQALELEESTRTVVESLLADYLVNHQRHADELTGAIRALRGRSVRNSSLARAKRADATLDRVRDTVDWTDLRERIDERSGDAARQARVRDAVDRLERSIGRIGTAIERHRNELEATDLSTVDPQEVLKLADRLRADRDRLRAQFLEGVRLILDEAARTELDLVVRDLLLEQARIDARFGGAGIDLQSALREALGESPMNETIRETLEVAIAEVRNLVTAWTTARLEREQAGLELFVAYEQDENDSSLERRTTVLGQRARSEIEAAIAVRNRLLSAVAELEAGLLESDPAASRRFAVLTDRQGFTPQVRPRWCERAILSLAACENLESSLRLALAEYGSDLENRLRPMREQAIRDRLEAEPRIARAGVDRMLGRGTGTRIDLAYWREPGAQRFRALDEEIELGLRALLVDTDCEELIPRRRGAEAPPDSAGARGNGGSRAR